MNVPLIQEPPSEAKRKLKLYRSVCMKKGFEEYRQAAKAYAQMAKGKPILDLAQAFESVPVDAKLRPMLGLARADQKEVELTAGRDTYRYKTNFLPWSRNIANSRSAFHEIAIPAARHEQRWSTGYSLVPMVPADCVPAIALTNFHILWEVEAWADRPSTGKPDRDPLLLRHLAGTLYAVEAAWDLTELERAIMAGLRRSA